jgi:predicted nucleic acid-binding protein
MGRLFLDSNVLIKGFVQPWSFDRAILKYCAARLHQMVYAEAVKIEVERFLRAYADRPGAELFLSDYNKFIKLAQPEPISYPIEAEVIGARSLIRHAADVPVLVSAIQAAPDWLITNNTEHFTPEVAAKTSLRIATPQQFVRAIQ